MKASGTANGLLSDSQLAAIPGGKLALEPAAAFNAMYAEARVSIRDSYRPLGHPGDLARGVWSQWAAWERYQQGGNLAARPGTSNHGWGTAIDLSSPADRTTVDRIGAKYGWSKAWSDAPGEWWHILYQPGHFHFPVPIPKDAMSISAIVNTNSKVEVFVEKTSGEVVHIAQNKNDSDWWRNPNGSPKWLSLGTPVMKRFAFLITFLVTFVGCGEHHQATRHAPSQHRYTVTINGHQYQSAHPPGFGLPPKGLRLPPRLNSIAGTLEMFDTVTVGTVPSNPRAVAGYTSGSWPTFWPLVNAFPRAFHVPIAVFNGGPLTSAGTGQIMCLDIEPGDAGPGDAGPWARYVRTHGMRPCEYSSLSEMGSVRSNLAAWGELGSTILWDANWTFSPHVDSGFSCTQWTDRSLGRNLDESTCLAGVFGPPPPPPDPYVIFPRSIPGTSINERATVVNWDQAKCQNPVRRHQCVVGHDHLIFLRGRISYLAHHVWGTPSRPNWSPNNGGRRWQDLNLRINATKPTTSGQV